jgi:hypothetical protein
VLWGKANMGAGGLGDGVPLTAGGVTYTAGGKKVQVISGSPGANTDIYFTGAVDRIVVLEVYGYDTSGGGNEFLDVVYFSTIGTPAIGVLTGTDLKGTPKTRTYTQSTGYARLSLATGAATYAVTVAVREGVVA